MRQLEQLNEESILANLEMRCAVPSSLFRDCSTMLATATDARASFHADMALKFRTRTPATSALR